MANPALLLMGGCRFVVVRATAANDKSASMRVLTSLSLDDLSSDSLISTGNYRGTPRTSARKTGILENPYAVANSRES